jgi:CRISPR system Cascade subunit CasE
MLLHKLHLDLHCKEVRRDISDPYEMHSTLCRAFTDSEKKCAPGTFLWRLEPETSATGMPIILVQGKVLPVWSRILVPDWFAEKPWPPIDIKEKLRLNPEDLAVGKRFRFRLRANPSVCRMGKRYGLYKADEQDEWLLQQGKLKGFSLETIHRSQELMLTGNRRAGGSMKVFSVLYEGVLRVTDPVTFIEAVSNGIGHGKTMGLGLLSIAPIK